MRSRERSTTRTLIAALAGISLVAAACGSDDADDDAADDDAAAADEVDTSDASTEENEEVVEDASEGGTPSRIVSLSATATETLFAIDAGDQIVAVDSTSNFPAEALELPNELSAFEPSVEAIAEFEPDLVLIGGDFTGLGDQLAELGIDSLDLPPATSIDDAYAQIERLGATTGHIAEAAEVVSQMQTEIDAIVDGADVSGESISFYHEIDGTYFTADSSTFIGEIYSLLGLENIADADESESFGFPQLNAEFIIDADPDVIFLPVGTFYMETPEGVASRPGWDAIAAVRNGDIIVTDDEIAGRWGPRIVEYLDSVATGVSDVGVTPEGG